jgi:hypothetical protein
MNCAPTKARREKRRKANRRSMLRHYKGKAKRARPFEAPFVSQGKQGKRAVHLRFAEDAD